MQFKPADESGVCHDRRTTIRAAGNVRICRVLVVALGISGFASLAPADDRFEFFEKQIRPVLVAHCYKCHSAEAKELKGELRLDLKMGWQLGGESGEPAILPGNPDESPLIRSVRHDEGVSAMPPDQSPLPAKILEDLAAWVKMGAPDPREGKLERPKSAVNWETEYRRRLDWWSLQPVKIPGTPAVTNLDWVRTEVDPFILAKLEAEALKPAPEAERRALARRLSFALTGLPASTTLVEQFVADASPTAYEDLVSRLLASPRFGERWARHWMDVVHYSDTHGYEWDAPAKNAWMYRDYLIRAFNADVPYRQMILEQLSGDLMEPRIDSTTGVNESLIGPAALRMGERRHGDNAGAEGVTQEAVSNMIDTIGKAFLGTTLACAQCHDHKLDAVEQRDYYALAGVLMSTRWSARAVDAADPNIAVIDELRRIKQQLRVELARLWLDSMKSVADKLKALPLDEKAKETFPESLGAIWQRSLKSPLTADEFHKERERRSEANRTNLKLLADFTREDGAAGWRWEGAGMRHGLVSDGEVVVADDGEAALLQILPAGRWSHVWSQRLAGSLQSPLLDPLSPVTFSVEMAAGKFAARSFIVDRALHSERMQFLNVPSPGWLTLAAGGFDSLEGSIDNSPRLVHLELVTKSLNNYFPPRTGYGGASEAEAADPRSWFGVTRVVQHAPGQPPLDELSRFAPLFDAGKQADGLPERIAALVQSAVERWAGGKCDAADVRLLNEALQLKLLINERTASPEAARLVAEYRAVEAKLQPDATVGSAADWNEGRNERIGVRGSYTEFGTAVERGGIRFLGGDVERQTSASSGRLELALRIADARNPLTARVYVNRIWHYLFGEGLVRTPDDFGHLGQQPSHPELLDYLAARFVAEGWSTKKLITLLVTSATWRQSSRVDVRATQLDPENRWWHRMPLRRLDAEAIRDSLLAVSGRLDSTLYGPPIEPFRRAQDPAKRLFIGPLDGLGRRSLYTEMTLMEPPRFLALFNQPLPKATIGRRDVTNVPDQALALLNDPFVVAMARHWSERLVAEDAESPSQRVERMFAAALARPPSAGETKRLVNLVEQSTALRGVDASALLKCQPAWQDAAHALFNLKEFIYVP